jgi:hypothetical protein
MAVLIILAIPVILSLITMTACIILAAKSDGYTDWSYGAVGAGTVSALFVLIFVIVACQYWSDGMQVKVFNKAYGTEYTQEEYFYSKDLIKQAELKLKDYKASVELDVK